MVKDVKYVSKLYIFKLTRTLCVSLQRTKLVLLNLLSLLFDICFVLFCFVFFVFSRRCCCYFFSFKLFQCITQ